MLSEACATGVPVHTASAAPLPDKLARFHAALRQRGLLTEPGSARADVSALRETQTVAAELRKRMAARAASK
jgi:mitochondrial fission protein ELM1